MAEIVDGNNLLGRLGGGGRAELVAELTRLCRAKGKRAVVVFDGPPESGRPKVQALGDVSVVFAAPRSADEEIVRRVQECRDPRGLVVVTDDRALASAVKNAGARTQGLKEFTADATRRLASAPRASAGPVKPAVSVSVKDWESWFRDPKNRI